MKALALKNADTGKTLAKVTFADGRVQADGDAEDVMKSILSSRAQAWEMTEEQVFKELLKSGWTNGYLVVEAQGED